MDSQTTLWYRSPATDFDHALPVGNGRIGGMLFGDPEHEVIKLNEDSVWSGGRRERNNPDAYEGLLEIRKLLAEEHIQAAEAVAFEKMQGVTPNARHWVTWKFTRRYREKPVNIAAAWIWNRHWQPYNSM